MVSRGGGTGGGQVEALPLRGASEDALRRLQRLRRLDAGRDGRRHRQASRRPKGPESDREGQVFERFAPHRAPPSALLVGKA